MHSLKLTVVAVVAFAASAGAQLGSFNPSPGPQGTFAIRGGRVITVVSRKETTAGWS